MRRRPPAGLHCPYCYEPFGRLEIEFRCSGRKGWGRPQCKPEPDKVLTEHAGREVTALPAFAAETLDTKADCPRCRASTTTRICPACHRPLPAMFGEIPSRMIALVGAKESGKTVFMTVLVRELMYRLGEQLHASIGPADDNTGHEFASYYEALLYGSDQLLPPTTPAAASDRTPLVWRLTVGDPDTPARRRGRRSVRGLSRGSQAWSALLSLFDPAGEDLLSQQSAEQNARYLAAADAIVLLLDPLQMPEARKLAAPGTRLPSPPSGAADTPVSVLQNITDLLLRNAPPGSDGRISKPLAVAFSKIDAFQPSLDPTSPLRQAPAPGPQLDEADSLSVHTEVQRLLDQWDGSLIGRIVRQHYRTYRYFGISALGETPTKTNQVSERGIRPYRVGDPLTWILSRLGVFPVRGR
jgi:hypothetical protein